MGSLKEQIKEIVEIVALVPESLKAQCFELLLKDALAKHVAAPAPSLPAPHPVAPKPKTPATPPPSTEDPVGSTENSPTASAPPGKQPKVASGSDIAVADLHMKTKKFMEKNGVSIDDINNLYYKEGQGYEALYSDLGVTGMSQGQIRVALLQCLHQSLTDGEFTTTVEKVREECKMRKCYDQTNFTKNFQKNASQFDFGEWSSEVTELRLSEEGRKSLAAAMKTVS